MSDVNEWLKERREIHDEATEGPWEDSGGGEIDQHWSCPTPSREVVSTDVSCTSFCYGGSARGILEDEDSAAIVDAHNTLPALLTAVEKVLELHQKAGQEGRWLCTFCSQSLRTHVMYPCPTVRAIEGAINEQ